MIIVFAKNTWLFECILPKKNIKYNLNEIIFIKNKKFRINIEKKNRYIKSKKKKEVKIRYWIFFEFEIQLQLVFGFFIVDFPIKKKNLKKGVKNSNGRILNQYLLKIGMDMLR